MKKIIVAAIAGIAMLVSAVPAKADPFDSIAHQHDMAWFCTRIAENPTVAGVESAVEFWLENEGTSDESIQTGAATLQDAVAYDCTQYASVVELWRQEVLARSSSTV